MSIPSDLTIKDRFVFDTVDVSPDSVTGEDGKPNVNMMSYMLFFLAFIPLTAFISRAWFSRVWIIQECALARGLVFQCGSKRMTWNQFEGLFQALRMSSTHELGTIKPATALAKCEWLLRVRQMTRLNRSPSIDVGDIEPISGCRYEAPRADPRAWHGDLQFFVTGARNFGATDPRDHIYGVLGLAEPSEAAQYPADYEVDKAVLWARFVKNQILRGRNADLLCEAGLDDETQSPLATWLPDLSKSRIGGAIYTRRKDGYSASGPTTAQMDEEQPTHVLALRGLLIDEITEVSERFELLDPVTKPRSKIVQTLKPRFKQWLEGNNVLDRMGQKGWNVGTIKELIEKMDIVEESDSTLQDIEPRMRWAYTTFAHANKNIGTGNGSPDMIFRGSVRNLLSPVQDIMIALENMVLGPTHTTQWSHVRIQPSHEAGWQRIAKKAKELPEGEDRETAYWRTLIGNRCIEPKSGQLTIPDTDWKGAFAIWRDLVSFNESVFKRAAHGEEPRILERLAPVIGSVDSRQVPEAIVQHIKDARERESNFRRELELESTLNTLDRYLDILETLFALTAKSTNEEEIKKYQELQDVLAKIRDMVVEKRKMLTSSAEPSTEDLQAVAGPQMILDSLVDDDTPKGGTKKDVTYRDAARVFEQDVLRMAQNRRFSSTKRGHIGWVPGNARKGDRIVVVFGASVPLIVRPVERDVGGRCFQLIGEAYVHGLMNGEGLRLGVDAEQIRLV